MKLRLKKTDINYAKILKARGLGSSDRARVFLANEVARQSDPYVPFRNGPLKNTRIIAKDGRTITYPMPYAGVHYRGLSKYGKTIRNVGAPMRGKEWDKRMMADHGQEVADSLAKFVGGKAK